MSDMKYKNYKELFKAYETGELTIKEPIILDNDDCSVYVGEEQVFSGGGYHDIEKILSAIGIPCEWC